MPLPPKETHVPMVTRKYSHIDTLVNRHIFINGSQLAKMKKGVSGNLIDFQLNTDFPFPILRFLP